MIALALALLLGQSADPRLPVVADDTGECFLWGGTYVQVPAVSCAKSPSPNYILPGASPENLAGAGWQLFSVGAAPPTATPSFATAPDGTLTATRLQIAACTTATWQSVDRANPIPADGTSEVTFRVRGNGTSGAVGVASYGLGPAVGNYTRCSFNASSWTTCRVPAIESGGTGIFAIIGCVNNTAIYPGSADTGAVDILVWGATVYTVTGGTYTSVAGVCVP